MAYHCYVLNSLKITLLYTSLPFHFVVLCCFILLRWSPFLWEQLKMQV